MPPAGALIVWALGNYLETGLVLEALRLAVATRRVEPGRVRRHSDRGVPYEPGEYTNLLNVHSIRVSPLRRGNAYDIARAESFIKTLKYEGV